MYTCINWVVDDWVRGDFLKLFPKLILIQLYNSQWEKSKHTI